MARSHPMRQFDTSIVGRLDILAVDKADDLVAYQTQSGRRPITEYANEELLTWLLYRERLSTTTRLVSGTALVLSYPTGARIVSLCLCL
jgi:hypothetical protein